MTEFKTTGEIIKEKRREKELTQKQLAEMLGITDKAVSKWERDLAYPDTGLIAKLAEILGISVSDLLNAKEHPEAEASVTTELDIPEERPRISDPVPYIPEEPFTAQPFAGTLSEEDYLFAERNVSQHKLLLAVQLIAVIIGVLFCLDRESLLEKLSYFVQAVVVFGTLIRLIVILFQKLRFALGQKIYDGYGSYVVVPRNGRAAIAAYFLAVFILFAYIAVLVHAGIIGSVALYALMGVYYFYCVYCDISIIKSQGFGNPNPNVRKVFLGIGIILAVIGIISGVIAFVTGDYGFEDTSSVETEATLPSVQIDAAYFENNPDALTIILDRALQNAKQYENEDVSSGYQITIPSEVFGVFYLQAKDPDWPHKNWANGVEFENAVAVITGYYIVNNSGFEFERYEWQVYVCPNFSYDTQLSYEIENEYDHHDFLMDNPQEVFDWLSGEYDDVVITEINIG